MQTLQQYLQELKYYIWQMDGSMCSELLSFRHLHVKNQRLQLEDAHSQCSQALDSPYDELVAAHLRGCWAVARSDYVEAFACEAAAIQFFVRAFQSHKDTNWGLPVMYTLISDLHMFARMADRDQKRKGVGKPNETVEKAADCMMSCFRVCVGDNRSSLDVSKKWGIIAVVNHLFKIYFKINKLQLCKPLIRAIEGSTIRENFRVSHLVTYRYYVGRKAMFDNDYKLAAEYLTFAFEHCHRSSRRNKRLALVYLIPVKMFIGYMPSIEVLRQHNLMEFSDVARSVQEGNLRLLNEALSRHEAFFIKFGIYLILERLKVIMYRNLFKKVFLLLGTHQLPLKAFIVTLQMLGEEDMDIDEAQCIIANLIDKNYIRGYISYQHKKLVISKQNPFPRLPSPDAKIAIG
ncbi:PCI domain-containing protein 2-like [Corticium candelabrum]|uniref:PCI domain-containing protein 2-like n=1 Tax=Corticium candelabrum TaxID=121492 RepID=UPI002E276EF5|nr:PCI domain-containing protein 2-like [Corticium candelabrum]